MYFVSVSVFVFVFVFVFVTSGVVGDGNQTNLFLVQTWRGADET